MDSLVLAYIDPGAGSAVLQLLLAGLAGTGVLFRLIDRRLKEKFWRRGSNADRGTHVFGSSALQQEAAANLSSKRRIPFVPGVSFRMR